MRVEDHPPVGVDRIPADAEQLVDILLLDPAAADLDLDAGDGADQPAGREADEDVLDIGRRRSARPARPPRGSSPSVRSMSAMKPRLTPRLSRWPVPRILKLAVLARLGDQRRHLRRADVERGDQLARRAWTVRALHQIVRARIDGVGAGRRGAAAAAPGASSGTVLPGSRETRIDELAWDRACRSGR